MNVCCTVQPGIAASAGARYTNSSTVAGSGRGAARARSTAPSTSVLVRSPMASSSGKPTAALDEVALQALDGTFLANLRELLF